MYLSITRPDLNYLKFNAAVSFTQKQEASDWMNGFCLRKGEGYFNTEKTEKIAIRKEDKISLTPHKWQLLSSTRAVLAVSVLIFN